MPSNLVDMDIQEISLVDVPANPGAHVLLYKSLDGLTSSGEQILEGLQSLLGKFGVELAVDKSKVQVNMARVLSNVMNDIAASTYLSKKQKTDLLKKSAKEFADEVGKSVGTSADYNDDPDEEGTLMKVDLTKMSSEDKAQLLKSLNDDPEIKKQQDELKKKEAADLLAKQEKEKAEKAAKDKMDEEEKAAKEKMEKELGENVAKAIEPLQKKLDEQAATIKKFQDADDQRTRLAKARELVGDLKGVTVESVADMLKGMTDEQVKALEVTMKAANAQVKTADILRVSGATVFKEGSAMQIAKSKAEDLRKSDAKLTEEAALAKVWVENPALYDQHQKELH